MNVAEMLRLIATAVARQDMCTIDDACIFVRESLMPADQRQILLAKIDKARAVLAS